jgi:hypothetical protein
MTQAFARDPNRLVAHDSTPEQSNYPLPFSRLAEETTICNRIHDGTNTLSTTGIAIPTKQSIKKCSLDNGVCRAIIC